MNEVTSRANEIAKSMNAEGAKYKGIWEGYSVFEIVYGSYAVVGYPLVILAKDSAIRLSTQAECLRVWREYNENKN